MLVREREEVLKSQTDHRVEHLKAKFPDKAFTMSEVMSALNVARTTATTVLKEGVNRGILLRAGSGKNIKYRIAVSMTSSEKKPLNVEIHHLRRNIDLVKIDG